MAVVDDDPTGTQTVQNVWVTTSWEPPVLADCLGGPEPLFFISTNSRALDTRACETVSREVGRSLRKAATRIGRRVILASRSDSTLRGHFPSEVLALCRGLRETPAAVLLVPAFLEAGRYTVGDVHWATDRGGLVPASETEFARDPTFGYRSRELRSWVEEKTGGAVARDEVASLPLELVRSQGPVGIAAKLREIAARPPRRLGYAWALGPVVVCNAASYDDLTTLALGVSLVEREGMSLVYRTAASFLKARAGVATRQPLVGEELTARRGAGLEVAALLDPESRDAAVRAAAARADDALRGGTSAIVATTRGVIRPRGTDFLGAGRAIMDGLCDAVRRMEQRPAWILAKGGITSLSVARVLGVQRARVLGQAAPGVPVWKLGPEARYPDTTYVVFPGNVGDDTTLHGIVRSLTTP